MIEFVLVMVGVLLTVVVWFLILKRWSLGLELYILFIPLSGAVELWLHPAAWAVLIKDVLFVTPAYIGFILSNELKPALLGMPRSLGALMVLFVCLVLVQAVNPEGPGVYATLIGLKVWLFYFPMILLGRAYVRDLASLLRLSRLMIGLIWLPCMVGILQWVLALRYGQAYAIGLFYGAAARDATQGFTQFDNGLMRIPSTFAFPAQYLNYVVCMFIPVLGCSTIEVATVWQKVRLASFGLLCVAGFMSGVRSAFVMIPLALSCFYFIMNGVRGAVWSGFVIAAFLVVSLSISKVDPGGLLQMESDLTQNYAASQTGLLTDAVQLTLIGRGVGTSTGAARLAIDNPDEFVGFESYYAKAVAELGVLGCALIVVLQLWLLRWALRIHSLGSTIAPYAAAIAAALLTFLVCDYKGSSLDLDPVNMLYWLFVGVLFSLPGIKAGDWENAGPAPDLIALG